MNTQSLYLTLSYMDLVQYQDVTDRQTDWQDL